MVPFACGLTDEPVGSCASFALPGVGGRDAAINVDDVPGRFRRPLTGQEGDRFGDVLRIDVDTEACAVSVKSWEVLFVDAVRRRAFRFPVGRPDAGAGDDRVWIDGIDPDSVRATLLCKAPSEVERRRLGR